MEGEVREWGAGCFTTHPRIMFAALYLPDLSVLAVLRRREDARVRPCAVLEVVQGAVLEKVKLPLLAVNEWARGAGIDVGWPLNRALVRCPDLLVLPPDPAGEAELLQEMIGLAECITPDLEVAGRDTLLLDLSRASSKQASGLGSLEMLEGELCHVKAATPDLAWLAVRHAACHGRYVSAEDIQALPLELPSGVGVLGVLEDWGLRTMGDFMALARQDLMERLGRWAGEWHDLLHGKRCRLLRLHRPPENMAQSVDFEDGIALVEPLVFTFRRLLHALSARLMARHVAVKSMKIGFRLESGVCLERVIRLPEPRVGEVELLRPVEVLLETVKLKSPVSGLSLDVETMPPTAAQRDWFVRQLPRPERWSDTLARLDALLGPGRTGIPVPSSGHRPDDFHMRSGDGSDALEEGDFVPNCPVPLRRFRPPHEIAVAFAPGPRPLALLSGPYRGEIVACRGPFKHSGDWWDATVAWKRLEWDLCLGGQCLLRLAFLPPDRWCLEGIYA